MFFSAQTPKLASAENEIITIPLAVESVPLQIIIQWMEHHWIDSEPMEIDVDDFDLIACWNKSGKKTVKKEKQEIDPFDIELLKVDSNLLIQITKASNFLGINGKIAKR